MTILNSILVGTLGTLCFLLGKKLLIRMEVDDSSNQVAIHGVCGCWGTFAVGLFDQTGGTLITGSLTPVLTQGIGLAAVVLWGTALILVFLVAFRRMNMLQCPEVVELVGLDFLETSVLQQNECRAAPTHKFFLFH